MTKGNTELLNRPDIKAKRAANAKFVWIVTTKCVNWGEENGYGNLLRDFGEFMQAYKKAHETPDFYSQQTPERLMEMIADARRRMDKAMGALAGKAPNGHS